MSKEGGVGVRPEEQVVLRGEGNGLRVKGRRLGELPRSKGLITRMLLEVGGGLSLSALGLLLAALLGAGDHLLLTEPNGGTGDLNHLSQLLLGPLLITITLSIVQSLLTLSRVEPILVADNVLVEEGALKG